jgi:hypothetical protein
LQHSPSPHQGLTHLQSPSACPLRPFPSAHYAMVARLSSRPPCATLILLLMLSRVNLQVGSTGSTVMETTSSMVLSASPSSVTGLLYLEIRVRAVPNPPILHLQPQNSLSHHGTITRHERSQATPWGEPNARLRFCVV